MPLPGAWCVVVVVCSRMKQEQRERGREIGGRKASKSSSLAGPHISGVTKAMALTRDTTSSTPSHASLPTLPLLADGLAVVCDRHLEMCVLAYACLSVSPSVSFTCARTSSPPLFLSLPSANDMETRACEEDQAKGKTRTPNQFRPAALHTYIPRRWPHLLPCHPFPLKRCHAPPPPLAPSWTPLVVVVVVALPPLLLPAARTTRYLRRP